MEFRGIKQWPSVICAPVVYPHYREKARKFSSSIGLSSFSLAATTQIVLLVSEPHSYWTSALTPLTIISALSVAYGYLCPKIREISERAYDKILRRRLELHCKKHECKVIEKPQNAFGERKPYTKWILQFPNNKTIEFTHDTSVLEIKPGKLFTEEIRNDPLFFETHIFSLLKSIGLRPPLGPDLINHGEFHLGIKESFFSIEHLRNYLVDQYRHWELGAGILGEDPFEGKVFHLNKEADKTFKEVIFKLEAMIAQKKVDIDDSVYSILKPLGSGHLYKNFMISYNHTFKTLEHRYPRSYPSTSEMLLRFELFEKRIDYLNGISFEDLPLICKAKMTSHEKLLAFNSFLNEMGESLDTYKSLLSLKYKIILKYNNVINYCQQKLINKMSFYK